MYYADFTPSRREYHSTYHSEYPSGHNTQAIPQLSATSKRGDSKVASGAPVGDVRRPGIASSADVVFEQTGKPKLKKVKKKKLPYIIF